MGEDALDHGLLLDRRDELQLPTTVRAVLNVDIKHALQQLRPFAAPAVICVQCPAYAVVVSDGTGITAVRSFAEQISRVDRHPPITQATNLSLYVRFGEDLSMPMNDRLWPRRCKNARGRVKIIEVFRPNCKQNLSAIVTCILPPMLSNFHEAFCAR